MRYLPGLLFLLLAFTAPSCWAEEEGDKKIVIVEGKKFIPLRGARHFYGTSKPAPVAINKYAKEPTGISNFHRRQSATVKPQEEKPVETDNKNVANEGKTVVNTVGKTQSAPPPAAHANETAASRVLSIFAPEEKPPAQSAVP